MDILQTVTVLLPQILGEHLDQIARDCGLVIRERKFTGQSLLQMLVFTLLRKPDAEVKDFLSTAHDLDVSVCQAAVEKRFAAGQPLVDFLRAALQIALTQVFTGNVVAGDLLHRFEAVFVGDSSTIHLDHRLAHLFAGCGGSTGCSKAALKLHVLWELKTGRIVELNIGPAKDSDNNNPIALAQAPANSLLVYDLGYFDLARFAELDSHDAKYVSRYQHGTNVYDSEGEPVDLVAFLKDQKGNCVDQPMKLGAKQQLACRLIAVRMPEEVANRRRQKAAQKKGGPLSEEYWYLLAWTLLITNVAVSDLSVKAVLVLYRVRWQVELLFKLWKSHNGLARFRADSPALEQLALFYAKLLGVLLQHWLLLATAWQVQGRSLIKCVVYLQERINALMAVLDNPQEMRKWLKKLQGMMEKLGKVRKRKKKPSLQQLLTDPDILDWL